MWKQYQPEQSSAPGCSFCGNRQDQVDHLTAGPGGLAICDDCVALYRNHLEESAGNPSQQQSSCMFVIPVEHAALQVTITASIVVLIWDNSAVQFALQVTEGEPIHTYSRMDFLAIILVNKLVWNLQSFTLKTTSP